MTQHGKMTERDQREIEKFTVFLRLANQAAQAGVPQAKAAAAIYPDVYAEPTEEEVEAYQHAMWGY